MADQKQNQSQKKDESGNPLHPGADDPRHAPESGEQGEIDDVEERGARGDHAGERDESGRLGRD